jgi:hypothetical protein
VYDDEGRAAGPAYYALKGLGRAARKEELRYRYTTGQVIGLEGGLELIKVPED